MSVIWFFKLVLILVVAYIAAVAMMYATQTRMLFPTQLAAVSNLPLPESAVRLELATPDGERLGACTFPPLGSGQESSCLFLASEATLGTQTPWPHISTDCSQRKRSLPSTIAATIRARAGRALLLCLPMRRSSMIMS